MPPPWADMVFAGWSARDVSLGNPRERFYKRIEILPDWVAWAGTLLGLAVLVELTRLGSLFFRGLRAEARMAGALKECAVESLPFVSVIVPAKDEALHIAETVRSVLASDYADFELILVNDRSSDKTLEIIESFARDDSRIRVLSIESLPEGWTGKTHALYRAAEQAEGDVLVFTDADALWSPDALKRTLKIFLASRLDMLSLFPRFTVRGFCENVVYPHLAFGLSYFYPLPEVNDPAKSAALACGFFIVIRKQTYVEAGTWKRFRGEVTEDVALSKTVKANGGRLMIMRDGPRVRTRSFEGLPDICRFWKRTLYGALEKSIPRIAHLLANYVVLFILSMFFVLALVTVALGGRTGVELAALAVTGFGTLGVIVPLVVFLRQEGASWTWALAAPVGLAISAWIAFIALVAIVSDTGIEWRGSRYK